MKREREREAFLNFNWRAFLPLHIIFRVHKHFCWVHEAIARCSLAKRDPQTHTTTFRKQEAMGTVVIMDLMIRTTGTTHMDLNFLFQKYSSSGNIIR